jgi:hypothetical protein
VEKLNEARSVKIISAPHIFSRLAVMGKYSLHAIDIMVYRVICHWPLKGN